MNNEYGAMLILMLIWAIGFFIGMGLESSMISRECKNFGKTAMGSAVYYCEEIKK